MFTQLITTINSLTLAIQELTAVLQVCCQVSSTSSVLSTKTLSFISGVSHIRNMTQPISGVLASKVLGR